MKRAYRVFIGTVLFLSIFVLLMGCDDETTKTMKDQQESKMDQAASLMNETPTPTFKRSLERENISNRLKITNDPTQLTWIYPISNGRVIGRFPVRGKVTSGNKRLTSTQEAYGDTNYFVMEAPDEMGTYGPSNPYIFWFDPAGNGPFQWQGDYFITPVPYKIDTGYGTIVYEIDSQEEAKRSSYEKQIEAKPIQVPGE